MRLTLSKDEKYRLFTPLEEIPLDAQRALLLYEDKNFYTHFGIDFSAMIRAFVKMLGNGRKQGASTISMQLARLIHDIESSTISGKIKQIFKALQLERHYSKNEILEAYFNLAPYGDNIEGIGAASLIYFKTEPSKLSLPEIIGLTVIPQNPVKRNPSRNKENMLEARKRLSNMWKKAYPEDPQNKYLSLPLNVFGKKDIPFHAPHLTTRLLYTRTGKIKTTVDLNLQLQMEELVSTYVRRNRHKAIFNAAVFIVDSQTMETLTYIGSADFKDNKISGQVNGITAPRSPGSAMKPFIYALAMDQGLIHPLSLLKDLPRAFIAYNPENFDNGYQGMVSATTALVDSLNIPAVDLLRQLSPGSFYSFLKRLGVKGLKPENHYGLAMALGGYEISLAEMVKAYAALANDGISQEIITIHDEALSPPEMLLSPESSFLTRQMLNANRPLDGNMKYPVSWKTGTSYSYKDAWTIGIAGKYVIGVWIGNFDGTPNHSFVGRTAAAPLFFEIVRTLEKQDDFSKYIPDPTGLALAKVDICANTGDIANEHCPQSVKGWFIPGVSPIRLSKIHREIPIDVQTGLRACRHMPPQTKLQVFEFWPSDVLAAFAAGGIRKKLPPPFAQECTGQYLQRGKPPEIVYPAEESIYVVRSHKLEDEMIILQASTDTDAEAVYWFLNDALLGKTKPDNPMSIIPKIGTWEIKAVDDKGRTSTRQISVQLEN